MLSKRCPEVRVWDPELRELQSRPSGCNYELGSEIETNWIIYTINNLIETFENSLFKQAFWAIYAVQKLTPGGLHIKYDLNDSYASIKTDQILCLSKNYTKA